MKKILLFGIIGLLLMSLVSAIELNEPIIYNTYSRAGEDTLSILASASFQPRTRLNTQTQECIYFAGSWSCVVSNSFCKPKGQRNFIRLSNSFCKQQDDISSKVVKALPVDTVNKIIPRIGFRDVITDDLRGIVPDTVNEQIRKVVGADIGQQCRVWTECDQTLAQEEGKRTPLDFRVNCLYSKTAGHRVCVLRPMGSITTGLCPNGDNDCEVGEFCKFGRCTDTLPDKSGNPKPLTKNDITKIITGSHKITKCSDGTEIFECSKDKPFYCDPKEGLIMKAQVCGCKEGEPSQIAPDICPKQEGAPLVPIVSGGEDICSDGVTIRTRCSNGEKVPLKICVNGVYHDVDPMCDESENAQISNFIISLFLGALIGGALGFFIFKTIGLPIGALIGALVSWLILLLL